MKIFENLFETLFRRKEFSKLSAENLDLKRRVREFEIDVEEKKKLITSMKKEYLHLENSLADKINIAKDEEIYEFLKEISTTFSQVVTMKKLGEDGKEIRAKDLFRLIGQVEKSFLKRGLLQIGEIGGKVCYNSSFHEPLGNFSPKEGREVFVRFCGYRFKEKLLKKALVGNEEA